MRDRPSNDEGWICTFKLRDAILNYKWAERNRPDAKPLRIWARRCYRADKHGFGFDTYVQFAVCFGVDMDAVKDGHWREIRKAYPEDIIPMTIEQLESLVPAFPISSGPHVRFPDSAPMKGLS